MMNQLYDSRVWHTASEIGRGFVVAYDFCSFKLDEIKERGESDYLFAGASQACLTSFAAFETFQVLANIGRGVSYPITYSLGIAFATSLNATTLYFQDKLPAPITFVAKQIFEHIGTVALTVGIATSVLFCFQGYFLYGATSLILYSVSLLEETGHLSDRKTHHFFIASSCRFIFGGLFGRLKTVTVVAAKIFSSSEAE